MASYSKMVPRRVEISKQVLHEICSFAEINKLLEENKLA